MRECLSLNLELMDLASLVGQQGPMICLSLPAPHGASAEITCTCHGAQAFDLGVKDQNLGSHVCMASTVSAEPSP